MYKIVSFRYESVILFFAPPPPNHKSVPTVLRPTLQTFPNNCFRRFDVLHQSFLVLCWVTSMVWRTFLCNLSNTDLQVCETSTSNTHFKMAAPMRDTLHGLATASGNNSIDPNVAERMKEAEVYMTMMDRLIGEKKVRENVIVPRVGIPQPERPPEEVKIARLFESCLFKTGLSCILGTQYLAQKSNILYHLVVIFRSVKGLLNYL